MKRIDAKRLAAETKQQVATEVAQLRTKGIIPKLTVFLVGEDPASMVYVGGKAKDCAQCGIASEVVPLPDTTTEEELLAMIRRCNDDPSVSGILVQLPLPAQIREQAVLETIAPEKDVDGFSPINIGRMMVGEDCFLPCTPAGCIELL